MPPPNFKAVPEELGVVCKVAIGNEMLTELVVAGDDEAAQDRAHVSDLRVDAGLLGPPREHVDLVGVLGSSFFLFKIEIEIEDKESEKERKRVSREWKGMEAWKRFETETEKKKRKKGEIK